MAMPEVDSSCSRATFLLKVGQYWTSMEMPEVDSSCSRATFLLKVGQYWTSMEMPEWTAAVQEQLSC